MPEHTGRHEESANEQRREPIRSQQARAPSAVTPVLRPQGPGGGGGLPFAAGIVGVPAILALQASMGNRAVSRVVAASRAGPPPVGPSLTKATIGTTSGGAGAALRVQRLVAVPAPSTPKIVGPRSIAAGPVLPSRPGPRLVPAAGDRGDGDRGWLRDDSPPPLQPKRSATTGGTSFPGGMVTLQPTTIQRQKHNDNWFNYINAYRIQHGLPKNAKWHTAKAAAAKLDFKGDRVAIPAMALTTIPAAGGNPAYVGEMDDVRAFLGVNPAGALHSSFDWGPTNAQGFGTWVKATLLPTPAGGTAIVGSAPSTWEGGWKELRKRKLADMLNTVFVRGHLLHSSLGGPGLDYNLAPLTNAANGDWGANHANWAHRFGVEGPVLGYYRMMHAAVPLVSKVEYEVQVLYGAHGRANQIGRLNNVQIGYNLALGQLGGAPTHTKTKNKMIANAVPYGQGSDAWEAIEEAVDAQPAELAANVDQRLKDNHALWVYEDANVPLQFTAAWKATLVMGGIVIPGGPVQIPNVLPQTIDAFYQ